MKPNATLTGVAASVTATNQGALLALHVRRLRIACMLPGMYYHRLQSLVGETITVTGTIDEVHERPGGPVVEFQAWMQVEGFSAVIVTTAEAAEES